MMFEDENMATTDAITNWYKDFKTIGATEPVEKKEVKKANPALSDLMLYTYQIRAYTDFLNSYVSTIEQDIRNDIMRDNTIPVVPVVPVENAVAVEQPVFKPLAYAVKNREGFKTAAENVFEVAKAIDSILARVKGIE